MNEKPNLEGVLPIEKAHDLANMAYIKMEEGNVKQYELFHKDYENAIKEIEILQKLAEDQTKAGELQFYLKKILVNGGRTLLALATSPVVFGGGWMELASAKGGFKENYNKYISQFIPQLENSKKILQALAEKGDEFGRQEIKNKEETV